MLVSNDGANTVATRLRRGVVTVVPLTSNVARVYTGFETLVSDREELATMGLGAPSKAQAVQLRAVSVERIRGTIGRCPNRVLDEIDEAIRFHLSL